MKIIPLGTSLVKNPPSNAGDVSLTPGLGTEIPHAAEQLSLRAPTSEACALWSLHVFTLKLSDLKQQSCNISLVPAGCLGVALGFVQLGQFCSICLSSFSGQWISKTYPHRNG